jgi:serine/threonine protein kinase
MPVRAGTVLGRYRLLEKAGQGGMSDVWKAEDQTLHRTVAVKVIHQPIASDPTYRERFLREARLVAGLEHPNVLPIYDFGTQAVEGGEVSFLVMPLVMGGSMKGRITGPVPFPLAVSWLTAVASALDYAHARGILHRDVKPANVLLDSRGIPLLADFGLARSTDSVSGLTVTGTVLGTPLYMSPEQATGGAVDGRADQYALAVIAFELLTGRVPFTADSPVAVLHQHVSAPPVPVTSVLPGAPKDVDTVMARALAKQAADRFGSCAEFVTALGAALRVPVSTPTLPAAIHSQAATVVSGPELDATRMASPASVPPPPAPGRRLAFIALAAILVVAFGGVAVWLSSGRTRKENLASELHPTVPASLPAPVVPATADVSSKVNETVAGQEPAAVVSAPDAPVPPSHPSQQIGIGTRRGPTTGRGAPGAAQLPAEEKRHRVRHPPLLRGAEMSGDTGLAAAWQALDNSRRPSGRLERADFVNAMGSARQVLATRPGREARFLDAFSRAGVAFADGRSAEAWQLLIRALEDGSGAVETRTLRFVRDEVRSLGPNPGPDQNWVMGLAFANVRGDLEEELAKAEERAPGSERLRYARSVAGRGSEER